MGGVEIEIEAEMQVEINVKNGARTAAMARKGLSGWLYGKGGLPRV